MSFVYCNVGLRSIAITTSTFSPQQITFVEKVKKVFDGKLASYLTKKLHFLVISDAVAKSTYLLKWPGLFIVFFQ